MAIYFMSVCKIFSQAEGEWKYSIRLKCLAIFQDDECNKFFYYMLIASSEHLV